MKILNPLYDWAFYYLLNNNDIAKKFLSAILKQNVTQLEVGNVELPLLKEGEPFYTRLNFKAIIEINGNTEEVLIVLHKYRNTEPSSLFRTYLSESYMKKESYKDTEGNFQESTLPLMAIYILSYCPPEFKVPYVIVRNEIYNGIDETKLSIESPIVKQLTSTAYFLITTPPPNYKWKDSRQETIIQLFRQKMKKEKKNSVYELESYPQDEVAKEIAEYLYLGTQNEAVVKQLCAEEDYFDTVLDLMFKLKKLKQET